MALIVARWVQATSNKKKNNNKRVCARTSHVTCHIFIYKFSILSIRYLLELCEIVLDNRYDTWSRLK